MSTLRERAAPKARVLAYIKDPVIGPSATARSFVELVGFRNVSTTISRTGNGVATVTFPNYKGCLIRYASGKSIKNAERGTSDAATTNDLAEKYMARLTGAGGSVFKNLWNDVTLSSADKPVVNPVATSAFSEYGRSRGDLMDGVKRNAQQAVNQGLDNADGPLLLAVPFLDIFDPIFVDYQGQDGFWYAGFTGLISKVSESYNKTGDQSLTINCKDLSCLLDNVSIVSGWNRMAAAEQNSSLANFVYASEANLTSSQQAAYGMVFESYTSVQSIIEDLIKRSQDMWRLEKDGAPLFGEGVGSSAFRFDLDRKPGLTGAAFEYKGISGRRGSCNRYYGDNGEDPYHFTGSDWLTIPDDQLEINNYLAPYRDIPNAGSKKIFIDPLIMKFDQKFIHKLINNSLALYKDSLKSADQILNDIVAKIYAYKYFDANGNLIIELARPNAFPNLVDYSGRSSSVIIKHEVPKEPAPTKGNQTPITRPVIKGESMEDFVNRQKDPKVTLPDFKEYNNYPDNTKIFTKKGYLRADASPIVGYDGSSGALSDIKKNNVLPKNTEVTGSDIDVLYWTTLDYHGKNYILSPDDFQSFTTDRDESAFVTVVAAQSEIQFLNMPENLRFSGQSMHAVAVADMDKLSKLGVRRFQAQSLYNVVWPTAEAGSRVLSYQAAAVMDRINAQADSGTMTLNQRPDLQLGRTIINPLRMKSYIIESITNSWSPEGAHTTSLRLEYGHPMHKTLEVPWLSIFAEPELFFGSDHANVIERIQPTSAEGMSKVGEGSDTFKGADNKAAPGKNK